MIPVAGSAYTYAYAVLGELAAWIIGWDLLLEYALVVAVVSIGWSAYLQALLAQLGLALPDWASGAPGTGRRPCRRSHRRRSARSASPACLTLRIEWGARFNTAMVIVKIAAVLFVIVVGPAVCARRELDALHALRLLRRREGAAVVFFAVFGYDTLTTAAEEARDPQRDLPRAVLLSLAVSLTLYIAMSLVLTGIVRYDTLDNPAPVATGLHVARPALGRLRRLASRRSRASPA